MSSDEDEDKAAPEPAPDAAGASVFGGPVGRGRPPRRHCFPPGVSVNPRGRPKGARGLKADVAQVMNEMFRVGEGRKRISARKAMLMKQREKAIKQGDTRATTLLLGMDRSLEEEAEARALDQRRAELEAEDEALLEAALQRLAPKSDDKP
jgi:hypothetical protein